MSLLGISSTVGIVFSYVLSKWRISSAIYRTQYINERSTARRTSKALDSYYARAG